MNFAVDTTERKHSGNALFFEKKLDVFECAGANFSALQILGLEKSVIGKSLDKFPLLNSEISSLMQQVHVTQVPDCRLIENNNNQKLMIIVSPHEKGLLLNLKPYSEINPSGQRAESLYRSLLENSLDGVMIIKNKIIEDANQVACSILGFESAKNLKGHSLASLLPEIQSSSEKSSLVIDNKIEETVFSGSNRFELIFKRTDGRTVWSDVTLTYFDTEDEKLILAVFNDITQKKSTERALVEQKELIEGVFDGSAHGMGLIHPVFQGKEIVDFSISLANPALRRILQLDNQFSHSLFSSLVVNIDKVSEIAREVLNSDKIKCCDLSINVNQQEKVYNVCVSAHSSDLLISFYDITEKIMKERQLLESERFNKKISEILPATVTVFSPITGEYKFINHRMGQMLGYDRAEFEDKGYHKAFELVHPDDIPSIVRKNTEGLEAGNSPGFDDSTIFEFEYRIKAKSGEYKWLKTFASIFSRDENHMISEIVNISFDITSQKSASLDIEMKERQVQDLNASLETLVEERTSALRLSESRLLETQKISRIGSWSYTDSSNSFDWSEEVFRILDLEPVIVFRDGLEHSFPELKGWIDAIDACLENGQEFLFETNLVTSRGNRRYIQIMGKPGISDEKVHSVIGAVRDISDIRISETALEKNRQLLKIVTDSIPGLIGYVDSDERYQFVNQTYVKWFGEAFNNAEGKLVSELMSPLYYESIREIVASALKGEPQEFATYIPESSTADGVARYTETRYIPDFGPQGEVRGIITVVLDVTHRHLAEIESKKSHARFKAIADSIPNIVFTADISGKIDFLNNRWYEITKRNSSDILSDWTDYVLDDDRPELLNLWKLSIAEKKTFQHEFRILTGDSHRWMLGRAVPLVDSKNSVIKWFGTLTDIQEHKAMQNKKDEFIGIASHELKTPLTSLKAYLQLLESTMRDKEFISEKLYVAKANTYLDKLNRLISDLLDVSKIQSGKLSFNETEFAFDQFVYETAESLQHISGTHKIEITGNTGRIIKGDKQRLEQVVINLVSNAIKYSPDENKISIQIGARDNKVIVGIRDYGIGIPAEEQKRIFDRFYRVEQSSFRFSGLGIGLFISSEIIKRHQGNIWLESEPGKGCCFYFELPA